ncbi:MAG: lipopolysaccharide biosynthesis protein [Bacteroidales bacterium]|nr:lipopolysaccharide biosynthesis protein [Bacteroidales bacterium]
MDLKQKAAQGLFWGGVSNVVQQLLNLAFGIFLARKLGVDDYGTVGMLTIFAAIANAIQESGFRSALTNRKDITHDDYNSVFWTSLGLGVLLYVILFFSAPIIADFFNEPVLVPLGRFLFLGFLISSTGVAHNAYLFKNLMAKEMAKSTLTASVISGVLALVMAYNGFAFWGIAAQNVVYILVTTIMFWIYSDFRPKFRYNFQPIREMLPYSSKLLITTIFHLLNENFFTAFLGNKFNKLQVGYYSNGYKWQSLGTQTISLAIENVMQPVLAKTDKSNLLQVFCKLMAVTVFISFPCLMGLGLIAPEFIEITIEEKWLPSADIMTVLCIWGAMFPLCQVYQKQLLSAGKSGWMMICVVTRCLMQFAAVFATFRYGIFVMVCAFTATNVLSILQVHYYVHKINGVTIGMLFKSILPYLSLILISCVAGYLAASSFENIYIRLCIKIAVVAVLYLGGLWISGNGVVREVMAFLKGFSTHSGVVG